MPNTIIDAAIEHQADAIGLSALLLVGCPKKYHPSNDGGGDENTEAACDDGISNDGDPYIDCNDYDCDCTIVCGGAGCECTGGPENTEAACTDGCSNDADDLVELDHDGAPDDDDDASAVRAPPVRPREPTHRRPSRSRRPNGRASRRRWRDAHRDRSRC